MQRGAAPLCTFIEYELIQISAFLILDKSIAECLFFRSPQIPEIRSKLPPKERTREEAVACPLMKEGTQRLIGPNMGGFFFSLPFGPRAAKVGVGVSPQNAFGCQWQAKRSACPALPTGLVALLSAGIPPRHSDGIPQRAKQQWLFYPAFIAAPAVFRHGISFQTLPKNPDIYYTFL